MNAQPITCPDRPFSLSLSACSACIFLHLRLKDFSLTMLPTDHYRSVDGAVPRRVSRTRLLAPRSFRAILPAMDKDVPRAHHDMGGVSKFLCEPVDVEPHALTDFDKEVDALSRCWARSAS